MPKENELTQILAINDLDLVRVVLLTGESRIMTASALKEYIGTVGSVPFLDAVTTGDDAGLICTGQWSVGSPGDGKEAVFGEGDSYAIGTNGSRAWHIDYGNISGMTVTGATEITTELGSETGSTTGLFGGTVIDSAILVVSDVPFGGTKSKMETGGTVEPGNVLAEYLQETSLWTRAFYMVTDADAPYEQKGNLLGSCSSCHEQWRFGFNPFVKPVPWDAVEFTVDGTPITGYWAIFRITSAITADPVMEQMKLHTNRFEVNADGFTEYFGVSRYSATIPVTIEPNSDSTPSDENIKISTGITIQRTKNEFRNTAKDGLIITGLFPEGVDTSIPIILIVDWYPTTDGVADVELELELIVATDEFVYDGNATPVEATPVVTSIDTNLEERQTSIFLVIAQTALPGDTIYGHLFRDASGSRTNDDYTGNVIIAGANVIAHFWKP